MKPYHVGIILDGNRRWAEDNGLPSHEGHRRGTEAVKKIITHAKRRGIKILTLFIFSTENWKRPKKEVGYLMNLIEEFFNEESGKERKGLFDKIKVKIVGERNRLSGRIRKIVDEIEVKTKENKDMVLNIALSYGGRGEIVGAVKRIIKEKTPFSKISEKLIAKNLFIPDLDLIIRTGKEQRLSNFFIWQSAYAELYFSPEYWPEFQESNLDEALKEYSRRKRRFGK